MYTSSTGNNVLAGNVLTVTVILLLCRAFQCRFTRTIVHSRIQRGDLNVNIYHNFINLSFHLLFIIILSSLMPFISEKKWNVNKSNMSGPPSEKAPLFVGCQVIFGRPEY